MIGLSLILMLRLVPYALTAVYATRKGYRWLTAFAFYLIVAAIVNVVFEPDADVRAIISSGAAVLLFFHVLNLKPRKGGEHGV